MADISLSEYIDRKKALLENPHQGGAGDSGEVHELRAKVVELTQKLVDKDRDALDARIDSLERKLDHPPSSSSSEPVQLVHEVANAVDKGFDRMSDKLQPILNWVFRDERLPSKKIESGAGGGLLDKLKPEWVIEE